MKHSRILFGHSAGAERLGKGAEDIGWEIGKTKSDEFPYFPELGLIDQLIQKLDQRYFAFDPLEFELSKRLMRCGNIIKKGLFLGEIKGRDFLPSHDLSANASAHMFKNQLELSVEQEIDFLKGNALHVACQNGPVLLTYNGLGLGFGKSNGSRINNLLPKHLRVF